MIKATPGVIVKSNASSFYMMQGPEGYIKLASTMMMRDEEALVLAVVRGPTAESLPSWEFSYLVLSMRGDIGWVSDRWVAIMCEQSPDV